MDDVSNDDDALVLDIDGDPVWPNLPQGWKSWRHNNAASMNEWNWSRGDGESHLWIQASVCGVEFRACPAHVDLAEPDVRAVIQRAWAVYDALHADDAPCDGCGGMAYLEECSAKRHRLCDGCLQVWCEACRREGRA